MAEQQDKDSGVWYGILNAALKIPGAKVDRDHFLQKEYASSSGDELSRILELGPAKAGLPMEALDKKADEEIHFHTATVTGTSFLAGLPGGIAMAGTIPADLAQYYWHVLVIAQKLAYVYGWPNLQSTSNEDFLDILTVFIGIMSGAKEANGVIKPMTEILASDATKQLPKLALEKVALPQIAKQVAKILGANLAKQGLARGIGKIIPLVGGAISGLVSFATYSPMANTLKAALREDAIK
jgi:uncharacterized membrane protein